MLPTRRRCPFCWDKLIQRTHLKGIKMGHLCLRCPSCADEGDWDDVDDFNLNKPKIS